MFKVIALATFLTVLRLVILTFLPLLYSYAQDKSCLQIFFVTHFSLRHKLYYKATEQCFSFINLNKKGDFIYERLWIWRLLVDHYPYSHILLLWLRRLRWLWKRLRRLWLRQWLWRLRMLI